MLLDYWVKATKGDQSSGSSALVQQPHLAQPSIKDDKCHLMAAMLQVVCKCTGKPATLSHTRADGIHDNNPACEPGLCRLRVS